MFSVVALEQQGPGFKSFFLVEFVHLVLVWVLSAASVFLPHPMMLNYLAVSVIGCLYFFLAVRYTYNISRSNGYIMSVDVDV